MAANVVALYCSPSLPQNQCCCCGNSTFCFASAVFYENFRCFRMHLRRCCTSSSCIRQSVTFAFLSVWCRLSYEAANCCCLAILCSLLAFPVSVSQSCWQFFPTGWHPVLCLMQLVDCHKCLDITAKRKYFMVSKPMDLC